MIIFQAVLQRIREQNLVIVRGKRCTVSEKMTDELYGEHQGRFFHGRLVDWIQSGPVIALELRGVDAVAKWRALLGPTRPVAALDSAPTSLRALYGLSDTRNAAHGSDAQAAERELRIFFGNDNDNSNSSSSSSSSNDDKC